MRNIGSFAAITVETVTSLTCTDDDMKIRLNVTELKWLYNDTNPAYISLVNEGCTGSTIGDTWAIDNPHSQCYTQRKVLTRGRDLSYRPRLANQHAETRHIPFSTASFIRQFRNVSFR